jgi:DNA replication protein DnaC
MASASRRRNASSIAKACWPALETEWHGRYQRGVEGRLTHPRLPWIKTLDQFDFEFQPSIDRKVVRELVGGSFIERPHNVVLLGPPGVGKPHLAIALAVRAVEAGYSVLFLTLESLMGRLIGAWHENRLDRTVQQLTYPRLLILDELRYLPLSREEASLFFGLRVRRYERGSVRDVIAMLEDGGWVLVGAYPWEPPAGPGTPPGKPADDLAPGTLNSVLKQAGLKKKE